MKTRRVLPYLTALLLLAWVLGSLARSSTTGGSLLSDSYWLVYTVELLPLIALGLIVVLVAWLIINGGLISDALGFGISRKMRPRKKKHRTVQTIIWMAAWGVVGILLTLKCGGLVCRSNNSVQNAAEAVNNLVSGSGSFPQLPVLGPLGAVANLVDTNLFVAAFLGILAVSSVIMARGVKVAWDETRAAKLQLVEMAQEQRRTAVEDAIRVLDREENGDPRARILACYQRMIKAASDLGALVGPDKTARELERGIRGMFLLKGPGIARLTGLFEEARYSLHPLTEEDSVLARGCLVEISEELSRTVSAEA